MVLRPVLPLPAAAQPGWAPTTHLAAQVQPLLSRLVACVGCTAVCSPAGGLGLPPKMDVMRRMKVDLPQPVRGGMGVRWHRGGSPG